MRYSSLLAAVVQLGTCDPAQRRADEELRQGTLDYSPASELPPFEDLPGMTLQIPISWAGGEGPDLDADVHFFGDGESGASKPHYTPVEDGVMVVRGGISVVLPDEVSIGSVTVRIDDSCGEVGCVELVAYSGDDRASASGSDEGFGFEELSVDPGADWEPHGFAVEGVDAPGFVLKDGTELEVSVPSDE